ncbi:hypothetical protein BJY01DRAFT_253970 [Aspergillus pseudoustus]|uniref:Uncharacterized protein n=1 Tax=Aspergillus pseudoustus TaxID=1810923 RepID=A0ABR4IWY8_9EURO
MAANSCPSPIDFDAYYSVEKGLLCQNLPDNCHLRLEIPYLCSGEAGIVPPFKNIPFPFNEDADRTRKEYFAFKESIKREFGKLRDHFWYEGNDFDLEPGALDAISGIRVLGAADDIPKHIVNPFFGKDVDRVTAGYSHPAFVEDTKLEPEESPGHSTTWGAYCWYDLCKIAHACSVEAPARILKQDRNHAFKWEFNFRRDLVPAAQRAFESLPEEVKNTYLEKLFTPASWTGGCRDFGHGEKLLYTRVVNDSFLGRSIDRTFDKGIHQLSKRAIDYLFWIPTDDAAKGLGTSTVPGYFAAHPWCGLDTAGGPDGAEFLKSFNTAMAY